MDKPIRFIKNAANVSSNIKKLRDNILYPSGDMAVTYYQLNSYCKKWFKGTVENTINNLKIEQFCKDYNSFQFSRFLQRFLEKERYVASGQDFKSQKHGIEQPPSLKDFSSFCDNVPDANSRPDRNGSFHGSEPILLPDDESTSPEGLQLKLLTFGRKCLSNIFFWSLIISSLYSWPSSGIEAFLRFGFFICLSLYFR